MTEITFTVAGRDEPLILSDYRVVVAGYTGRDEGSVRAHIEELAAIGIPEPDSVPAFYEMPVALATTQPDIAVPGPGSSGEVEPVLIRKDGELYWGVGSDHTDRDIERDSVPDAKAACPKPIGGAVAQLSAGFDWDSLVARTTVDGRLYQEGPLSALRIPTDVLALLPNDGGGDLILFGGTVTVIGGEFLPGTEWSMSLTASDGQTLSLDYRVTVQR